VSDSAASEQDGNRGAEPTTTEDTNVSVWHCGSHSMCPQYSVVRSRLCFSD
jgi:hypothetical protein